MNEPSWDEPLKKLRESAWQISLVVAGGGSGALARCFGREGASQNFVEAVIPYSHAAMVDYLSGPPCDSNASAAVAQQLACIACARARSLSDQKSAESSTAGIALVAALPTTPARRGADRIHTALHTDRHGRLFSVVLEKGRHSRRVAETIAETMVLHTIGELIDTPIDQSSFNAQGVTLESTRYET